MQPAEDLPFRIVVEQDELRSPVDRQLEPRPQAEAQPHRGGSTAIDRSGPAASSTSRRRDPGPHLAVALEAAPQSAPPGESSRPLRTPVGNAGHRARATEWLAYGHRLDFGSRDDRPWSEEGLPHVLDMGAGPSTGTIDPFYLHF